MHRNLKLLAFAVLLLTFLVYSGFLNEENRDNHTHHDHTDLYHDHSHSEPIQLPEKLLFTSQEPDRVILKTSPLRSRHPEKMISLLIPVGDDRLRYARLSLFEAVILSRG